MTVDFNDYFWGEKNNGFDVLYHNMKYGLSASKELSDYFRERSNIEENYSKLLVKLANKASSGCVHGTFAPIWVILKSSAERLSTLHLQMVQKITELVKEISKYSDDLHKKHKTVKDEEAPTLEAVQAMQSSTLALQKAKDAYTNRMQELEKIKKDNSSQKDIEKAEQKVKKQQDEYKNLAERHNPVKLEFEKRMSLTCKRFQEIEEAHLKQMREFLTTYIEVLQNNHDLVGQVHSDFRRQFLELTVDKLLEQFVLNKYTGLEKPETIELDLVNLATSAASTNANTSQKLEINSNDTNKQIMGITSSPIQPQMTGNLKKEINFKNWFTVGGGGGGNASSSTSTTATTTATATVSGGAVAASNAGTSSTLITTSPNRGGDLIGSSGGMDSSNITIQTAQQTNNDNNIIINNSKLETSPTQSHSSINSSTVASMKSNKSNHNWDSINKYSNIENNKNTAPNIINSSPQEQHQSSKASSRRTSSFFNLFISNSQVSGFLRSRRDKGKTKKSKKGGKESAEVPSIKDEKINDHEEIEEIAKSDSSQPPGVSLSSPSIAPTASGEVDEDGYSIKPKETNWENAANNEKGSFYSSSDSDSEDEPEKKIHVKIKPLNNGTAPISASVDELRATVENLSLSPLGLSSGRRGSSSEHDTHIKKSQSVSQQIGDQPSNDLLGLNLFQQHQSPVASNTSTPTTAHPYAPLQSPTLSVSNTSNKYGELGDIFSEFGDISASAPASANLTKLTSRQIPTPTSVSSIAIPRPPSRRSETAVRGRVSPVSITRAESVGSLEFRTVVGIGSSRGPSPLTIGMTDSIPVAVAFHEMVHAYFRGSDESRCQVKMSGDMMLSFPAGIVGILANNPNPAKLCFRIKNIANLDTYLPNKQLVTIDKMQSTIFSVMLEFNMPALITLLRRQSEQNPNGSYFNVDILKYKIRTKPGASSCPLQLVSYWKCNQTHTDIKIDYKYNSHAMASPSPLLNVSISVPVDGGVKNCQSKPHSAWLGESNRLLWNFTDISQHSDNHGIDTLRARLEVGNGPSTPSVLSSQFNCEGTTLSGIEFELAGPGYRLSLVKRRFVSGKYLCEADAIRSSATPTPPIVGSPSPNVSSSGA